MEETLTMKLKPKRLQAIGEALKLFLGLFPVWPFCAYQVVESLSVVEDLRVAKLMDNQYNPWEPQ